MAASEGSRRSISRAGSAVEAGFVDMLLVKTMINGGESTHTAVILAGGRKATRPMQRLHDSSGGSVISWSRRFLPGLKKSRGDDDGGSRDSLAVAAISLYGLRRRIGAGRRDAVRADTTGRGEL